MAFFANCIKGIFIGAGAILPGISSGVICVIFGIYEKLLDSILHFFKNIRKNIEFLLPIIIGGFIGVFLFGNLLNYIFYKFPLQTKSIFIGLILGSIPSLLKQIHAETPFNYHYLPFFFVSLIVGISSVFLENSLHLSYETADISFWYLLLCGICMSAGVIIPGVSSTVILMLLGVYSIYLSSVSTLFLPTLFPIGIGLVVGSLFFMILTKFLLSNYHLPTYYAIIGFSLGSIFVLLPTYTSILDVIISIACIILGHLILFFSS